VSVTDDLTLTYAGFNYLDRTLALQLGEISPAGIELRFVTIPEIGALFRRTAQHAEFDAAEMSLSTLLLLRSRGDRRLIGIPVFPSRSFRHSFIFVRADSGIEQPADLRGKRVGVQDYQATAYVWQRALLEHEHGVTPRESSWYVGGLDIPSPAERLRHEPPPGVDIRPVPAGKTVEGMLLDGELDAVMSPERLHSFRARPEAVRRLLPDYEQLEQDYFSRTGFFPIMHTVVLRRDVYESDPWVACALVDAFEASKQAGMARLRRLTSPALALPWLADAVEQLDQVFDGDPFPSGFKANRKILEAVCRYSHEQGLSETELAPEDVFAPETWDHQPTPENATITAKEKR
jgi:4,5-dihydroxyphthalate decarboxylase